MADTNFLFKCSASVNHEHKKVPTQSKGLFFSSKYLSQLLLLTLRTQNVEKHPIQAENKSGFGHNCRKKHDINDDLI